MYIPLHFRQPSKDAIHDLMRAHPLATLVTLATDESGAMSSSANHIPLHLSALPEPNGTLCGHMPRANPAWRQHPKDRDVIAIFHGPNAYVSPSWYASKQVSGEVVPTWNYATVHAYGRIEIIEDAIWLRRHLEQLTDEHEARFDQPWSVADAPENYTARLITALVGIRIVINRLEGKWKTSQNRSAGDRTRIAAGLRARNAPDDARMAALVESGA